MTVKMFAARTCILLSLPVFAVGCTLETKIDDPKADDDGDGGNEETSNGDADTGEPTGTAPPVDSVSVGDDDAGDDVTSAGETTSAPPNGCTPVELMQSPLSPNVVLVLDKSGSMVATPGGFWDHDDDPMTAEVTRWSSLHGVVDSIVTEFDDQINFGAMLYPSEDAIAAYNEQACLLDEEITIPVAAENMTAILGGIPAASDESLRGGTPVAGAMIVALDHLKTLDPDVPRAILLVTDGAANCVADAMTAPEMFEVYDEAVHEIVEDAFTIDEIPTYVVGVGILDSTSAMAQDGTPDNTNAFDKLNALAVEGGKPRSDPDEKFYNTNNQIELAAALDAIAVDALTCILPLQQVPVDPEATVVKIDGAPVPHVSDCQTESGWVYTNPQGPFDAIRMCGSACGGLKLTGTAELTICGE